MQTKSSNRRKFHRINFDGVACLKIGEHNYDCKLIRDLSLTGLFIVGDFRHHEMSNCVVRIFRNNDTDHKSFLATGKVVRARKVGIALQFTEMTFENYLLLKSTLAENAENSLIIICEFPDDPPFEINN